MCPNFGMTYNTIKFVSVSKFEVICTNENRVMGKEVVGISIVIWENGLVGNIAAAIEMYKNLKVLTLAFIGIST